jgi:hypothetical protein
MLPIIVSILIFVQGFSPIIPQAEMHSSVSEVPSATLCLPGIYMIDPQDCLPLGPSTYLTQMASVGIEFPLLPIPYLPIDGSLGELPFSYASLGDGPTSVYSSLEDAVAEKNAIRTIESGGLRYVSYLEFSDTENGRFFKLHDGSWVRVSSRISVPRSYPGGIEFSNTPDHSFGWIQPYAPSLETKRVPGYSPDDYTGHALN